jgi:hypothetical protein
MHKGHHASAEPATVIATRTAEDLWLDTDPLTRKIAGLRGAFRDKVGMLRWKFTCKIRTVTVQQAQQ